MSFIDILKIKVQYRCFFLFLDRKMDLSNNLEFYQHLKNRLEEEKIEQNIIDNAINIMQGMVSSNLIFSRFVKPG